MTTTTMSINNDELLKRKIGVLTGDGLLLGGPNQKILKRTPTSQLSDISLAEEFTFTFEEYEDDEEDDMNETGDMSADNNNYCDPTSNQQTKDKQLVPTQRRKPGRKPNPASPALRKAQNRAAQRAFRERKERHLKELESTIQSLRAIQTETTNNFHREREQLRSLIERVKTENYYLKYIAFNFECALNSINGNNEATEKIKNSILSSISRSSFTTPLLSGDGGDDIGNFDQLNMIPATTSIGLNGSPPSTHQLQISTLNLNNVGTSVTPFTLPSPANSSIVLSPKPTNISSPVSAISSPPTPNMNTRINHNPIHQKLSDQLLKSFARNQISSQLIPKQISANGSSNDTFISASLIQDPCDLIDSTFIISRDADVESIRDSLKDSYSTNFDVIPGIMERQVTKEMNQLIRLAKLIGCTDLSTPVKPMLKRPLTDALRSFLSIPHDPRIDLIPCLHLRSRMIQYQGQYDLYELCELLINKAKCHGDPMDPDSWECPQEFLDEYPYLVFQQCRLKSTFYQRFGELPANFDDICNQYNEEKACILVNRH